MPKHKPEITVPAPQRQAWIDKATTLLAKRGEAAEPLSLPEAMANWLWASYIQGKNAAMEEAADKAQEAIALLEDIG